MAPSAEDAQHYEEYTLNQPVKKKDYNANAWEVEHAGDGNDDQPPEIAADHTVCNAENTRALNTSYTDMATNPLMIPSRSQST